MTKVGGAKFQIVLGKLTFLHQEVWETEPHIFDDAAEDIEQLGIENRKER